jgi:hypothetical protein
MISLFGECALVNGIERQLIHLCIHVVATVLSNWFFLGECLHCRWYYRDSIGGDDFDCPVHCQFGLAVVEIVSCVSSIPCGKTALWPIERGCLLPMPQLCWWMTRSWTETHYVVSRLSESWWVTRWERWKKIVLVVVELHSSGRDATRRLVGVPEHVSDCNRPRP